MDKHRYTTVEMCAGGGGEALGLERAGFGHACLIECNPKACLTLRRNRPEWNVIEADLATFDARPFRGATMVSGGLPCPPYSVAGKQMGAADGRDLFTAGLQVVDDVRPDAIMLENVKGILAPKFTEVRKAIATRFRTLNYQVSWRLLNACDYGVPQLRPRVIFVALRPRAAERFSWPAPREASAPNVGETLRDLMGAQGWQGASAWAERAAGVAPTLVGGSESHGGADLGPTRARLAWERLGVDGRSVADEAPASGFNGFPRLTVRMAARLQGFPDTWTFAGKKTSTYRQVANALPPAVAEAVGRSIIDALQGHRRGSLQAG